MNRINALFVGLPIGAVIGALISMLLYQKKEHAEAIQALQKHTEQQLRRLRDSTALVITYKFNEWQVERDSIDKSHLQDINSVKKKCQYKLDSIQNENHQLIIKVSDIAQHNKTLLISNLSLTKQLKVLSAKMKEQKIRIKSKSKRRHFSPTSSSALVKNTIYQQQYYRARYHLTQAFWYLSIGLFLLTFLVLGIKRWKALRKLRTRRRWPWV